MSVDCYFKTIELNFCVVDLFRMRDLPKNQSLYVRDLPDITFKGYNTKTDSRAWYGVRLTAFDKDLRIANIHRVALIKTLEVMLKEFNRNLIISGDRADLVDKMLRSMVNTTRPVIYGNDGRAERIRIVTEHTLTLRSGENNDYYSKRGCYIGQIKLLNMDEQAIVHHPSLDITEFVSLENIESFFNEKIEELFPFLVIPSVKPFTIHETVIRPGLEPTDKGELCESDKNN